MSVEELAKELFPLLETDKIGNNPYITYNTEQLAKQEGFIAGYHQAEKDNELTWDDVSLLNCLLNEVEQEFKKGVYEDRTYKGYCQEVLKRFKAKKRVWRSDDET